MDYPAISALFKTLIPVFDKYRIDRIEKAGNFDFNLFKDVHITYFEIKINDKKKPLEPFFIIETGSVNNRYDKLLDLIQERFQLYGNRIEHITYKPVGNRDYLSPQEEWKREKIVFILRHKNKKAHIILKSSLLVYILKRLGLEYFKELQPALITEKLDKIEKGILYGNNRFFINFRYFLSKLDEKDTQDVLNRLVKSGYIEIEHLASLHLFFPELKGIIRSLPRAVSAMADKAAQTIMPYLSSEKIRIRWMFQIIYYFQNVLSRLIFMDQTLQKLGSFPLDSFKSHFLQAAMAGYENRNRILSLNAIINKIVSTGRVNSLISGFGKGLLVDIMAMKEPLILKNLYSMFKDSFKEEFYHKVSETRLKILDMDKEKKQVRLNEKKIMLYQYLDDDMEKICGKLQSMDMDKMIILYNKIGFEDFVSLFELFRYLPASPFDKDQADSFFNERISLLPETEKSIAEDIYYERLNRDRVLNRNSLERRCRLLKKRLFALEQLKYI
jgi:hypothetical protein